MQASTLAAITHARTSPAGVVRRAAIILAGADGAKLSAIARDEGVDHNTVRLWLTRWQALGEELARLEVEYSAHRLSAALYQRALLAILDDAHRSGRPPTFTAEQRQQVIALAKEKPEKVGVPITNWTNSILRDAVIARGIVSSISVAHVGRFLKRGMFEDLSVQELGASQRI